jgi:hypothetical protein
MEFPRVMACVVGGLCRARQIVDIIAYSLASGGIKRRDMFGLTKQIYHEKSIYII